MDIQIELHKEDWVRYQSYLEKELIKQHKTWLDSTWVNIVIWAVLVLGFMALFQTVSLFHWPTAIAVTVFFVVFFSLLLFNLYRFRKAMEPYESGTFCGTHHFIFSEHGIASNGNGYESHLSWQVIKGIERNSGVIMIFLDKAYAYVFPESKLDNPDEFYRYISERYSAVQDGNEL